MKKQWIFNIFLVGHVFLFLYHVLCQHHVGCSVSRTEYCDSHASCIMPFDFKSIFGDWVGFSDQNYILIQFLISNTIYSSSSVITKFFLVHIVFASEMIFVTTIIFKRYSTNVTICFFCTFMCLDMSCNILFMIILLTNLTLHLI